ncbi:MAG: glucosamine-6-phosphate deaminase [Firmicutes bacterium]|jgi:glucosamine-6-phosphate deaminase|nr:glucosamine-6-phosphate deaminase [Bacillota bacterium]
MQYIVKDDFNGISAAAYDIYADFIKKNSGAILGLATGSTPIGLYKLLIDGYKNKELDFSQISSFNLDEYVGLDPKNENSYNSFMWKHLFDHINIRPENVHIPSGQGENLKNNCREYDRLIASSGGIDLMLLGIGENGHIAFNEPAKSLKANTHVVNLCPDTIEVNSRFFDNSDDVPKQAITMGLSQILKSKRIVLLASGRKKAKAIARLIKEEEISCSFPVSFLRVHTKTTIILDKEAASLL